MLLGITSITYNNYNHTNFKAHPDFHKLSEMYDLKASNYFRRGLRYGTPSEQFSDIIKVFSEIFAGKIKGVKSILIAGIGDSQEPFSYLTVIKDLLSNKPLKKTVNLHTIDIQSRPDDCKLFEDSFLDDPFEPLFAKNSFIQDEIWRYGINNKTYRSYRVKDEIYDYLKKTYENPKKSLWDTRVQDGLKDFDNDSFDVVSINNTLMYIEKPEEVQSTLDNVLRILKKDGFFITDPYKYNFFEESKIFKNMEDVYQGIYKKVK